jgi:hypothetical protein
MATLANLNQEDENSQQPPQTGGQAPQVSTAPAAVAAPNSAAPAQTNQGSGRFTNINKYIGANQQAGQQISQRVGSGINQQLDTSARGAESNVDAFRQGVQKAEQSNQVGQGLVGQVNQGQVEQIAQAPDALKNYINYRTGMEAQNQQKAVGQVQSAADLAAQKAKNELAQRQQQLGTEQNRVGLLTEFVGSPGGGYSKGAQRLDQAFLQRDKTGGLNNLNRDLKTQEQTRFKAFVDNNKALQDQAKATLDASGKLTNELNGATQNQYKVTNDDIDETKAAVVAQREADINYARQQINALLDSGEKSQDTTVDAGWLKDRGVRQGQRTYGALTNLTEAEIATIRNAAATREQTVTDQQLAKYNALQKLMGSNIVDNQLQYDPSNEMKKAALDAAVEYKQGAESLGGRVNENQKKFEAAVGQTIGGYGTYGGTDRADAVRSQTIQDYLAGKDNITNWNSSHGNPNFGLNVKDIPIIPTGIGNISINDAYKGLTGNRGIPQDNYTNAENYAQADLVKNIQKYLEQYGYDETVGAGGRAKGNFEKDTSYQNLPKNKFKGK